MQDLASFVRHIFSRPGPVALLLCCVGAASSSAAAAGTVFSQVIKLTASDAAGGDEFGWKVDVYGDRAIVGARSADGSRGAAYVFERDAGGADAWGEVTKLEAPDGEPGDFFGWGVAISGKTALVGAPSDEVAGSAYVFERDPATGSWEVSAILTRGEPDDNFGIAVDLQGDRATVGASRADGPQGDIDGTAYVHERDSGGPGSWGQVAKLKPAVECGERPTWCGARGEDFFGNPVALDGDLVIAGGGAVSDSFVYVYQRRAGKEPGAWRRVARPTADIFSDGVHYGDAVGLDGDTLLVGAFQDREPDGPPRTGSAFIFERDPGGPSPWIQTKKLRSPDGGEDDDFGKSADLSGDLAVVGASQDIFVGPGYAWVFERDAGGADQWGAVAKLLAEDGEDGDNFGDAAAIDGATVIVGAHEEDRLGTRTGAAYIFERTPAATGPARLRLAPVPPGSARDGATWSRAPGRASGFATDPFVAHDPEDLAATPSVLPLAAAAPRGQEPLCFDFTYSVCDALELSVSGDAITGLWRNYDCEGADLEISGTVREGRALVRCDPAQAPCPVGTSWAWIIDLPLDGSMDMVRHQDGLWQSWYDEITYIAWDGACEL